ncbi:YafY family protein [Thioclava litoralis]|uniref:YafY family protein n=1 Tax=Thioclava litoralis TaxID=3076557 RepID=A0ABZ1E1U6_9RHOB|nr:YafY family protein [Thioclava sp. FTW29]
MSRSERLLQLLDILRRHRHPVTGAALAQELGVSLRTLYRDIATLQGQGAPIEGEAGLGYVLREGFLLPPLTFPVEELEALVVGTRWLASKGDSDMAQAAESALSRLRAVVPAALRDEMDLTTLVVGGPRPAPDQVASRALRAAIRQQQKLRITYRTGEGTLSERVIWPVALAFFDQARVLLGWCELRGDFRSFRTDRISEALPTGETYRPPRKKLFDDWRRAQGLLGC